MIFMMTKLYWLHIIQLYSSRKIIEPCGNENSVLLMQNQQDQVQVSLVC